MILRLGDTINTTLKSVTGPFGARVPREPAESDPDYVKHVWCPQARFHVLSYSGGKDKYGQLKMHTRCSEKKCIMNKGTKWDYKLLEADCD